MDHSGSDSEPVGVPAKRHSTNEKNTNSEFYRRAHLSPKTSGSAPSLLRNASQGDRGATAAVVAPSHPPTLGKANSHPIVSTNATSTQRKPSLSLGSPYPSVPASDIPSTLKLLSELERSWAMFAATWKVVDLFAGMQIWQEQGPEGQMEPLNSTLLSTSTAGIIAFLAGTIGGGGVVVAILLTVFVVLGTIWTMTSYRVKREVPCFKTQKVIDGSPSEIFLYLMNIKNYPIWDASIERASVVHTIDDHADIIHIVYRPVWMWPIWITPRDLCLLRYWRRAEDGSYVICLQSAIHPECPPTHDVVRAKCNGAGFIIAPRGLGVSQTEELTSMVTNVIHLDPQGWESNMLRRLNAVRRYIRPQIFALTGLQEVMEARKYVCPNVPEEFSTAMASAEELSNSQATTSVTTGSGIGVGDGNEGVAPLQDFACNVPRSMWAEPDGGTMMVRGPDYLIDRRKVPSAPPAFRLVGIDLFESSQVIEHIASRPDNIVQKEILRHEAAGTEMPFTFVINFVVPGNPKINMVVYYQAPNPSVLKDGSPFADLMADFLDGTDEFRDERFKLIPCIVEGSFIVRQAVGSTPAIIGKKLRQPCFRGKGYFELDVDIGSSAVANRVVGLVSGYTKKLVIDMGFLVEAQRNDELPERLFGTCRLIHLDMSIAARLD